MRFDTTAPHPAAPRAESADLLGIILDCDGVLFDSKEANTAYYNNIRYALQLPPMTPQEAAESHMLSTDQALEKMIPEHLHDAAAEVRSGIKYRDSYMSLMQPSPFVFDFLRNLQARGVRLALCTNRSDSVHEVLSHFDMEYFSPVMTITHARPKPDPQGLLEVLKMWQLPARSVAFIGDSLVDQQAAAAAGVPFWSFRNPELLAKLHISGFKELYDLLDPILAPAAQA